jgi:hypothetical protein
MSVLSSSVFPHLLTAVMWLALILSFVLQRSVAVGQPSVMAQRVMALQNILVRRWRTISFTLIVLGFVVSLALVWVLRAFPNSADEYSYLFGGETFLAGRLWNPLPAGPQFFAFLHILELNGKWATIYTPGWPILLTLGAYFHLPYWLVCPVIGLVFLIAVFRLAERQTGHLGAVLTVGVIALSPFFVFNAASYFNMVPTATAGVLFCWAALEFFDRPTFVSALLTGISLGALGFIRIYDVTIFSVTFAIGFLCSGRRRHYALSPMIVLGGTPFVMALLVYDYAITGSALTLTEVWGSPGPELGFLPFDHQMRFLSEILIAVLNIFDLGRWTSPIFLVAAITALFLKIRAQQWIFLDLIFPLNVIAYFFVEGIGGNRYGPRYYFVGYPFLVLTLVSILVPLLEDTARPRRVATALTLGAGHVAVCLVGILSFSVMFRTVVNERMDLYDQVRGRQIHNAVVVIHAVGGHYLPMIPRDLTRNGVAIGDQDVIYALDIPNQMSELRHLFPNRTFYIYSRKLGSSDGDLKRY